MTIDLIGDTQTTLIGYMGRAALGYERCAGKLRAIREKPFELPPEWNVATFDCIMAITFYE
jgi:hypothetical protein